MKIKLLIALTLISVISALSLYSESGKIVIDSGSDGIDPFSSDGEFNLDSNDLVDFKDYRENWKRLTGYEFSGLHWNHFIVIYMNKNSDVYSYNYAMYLKYYRDMDYDDFDDEEEAKPTFKNYPVGTSFLKEHFASQNGKPGNGSLLTMMTKREKGYDPEYGDWEYYWVDGTSGGIISKGNSSNKILFQNCIECHSNMADRDFVFSTFSRNDLEVQTMTKE